MGLSIFVTLGRISLDKLVHSGVSILPIEMKLGCLDDPWGAV